MTRNWTATSAGGMPVFFAAPDHVARSPCVIVIHERYGLVRHVDLMASRVLRAPSARRHGEVSHPAACGGPESPSL
jgi:hypothetical protein